MMMMMMMMMMMIQKIGLYFLTSGENI